MNRIPPAYIINCVGFAPSAAHPFGYNASWGAEDFAETTGALINRLADEGWPYIILLKPAGVAGGQVCASVWDPIPAARQQKIADVLIPAVLAARSRHPTLRVGPYLGTFYDSLGSLATTKETGRKILDPANSADYTRNMEVWRRGCNLEVYDFGANLKYGGRPLLIDHALGRAAAMGVEAWGEAVPRPDPRDNYADGTLMPWICRPDFIDSFNLRTLDVRDRVYRFWLQGYSGGFQVPDPSTLSAVQRQALVDDWAGRGWGFACQGGAYGAEILANWRN